MSISINYAEVVDLAKAGGRLSSNKQWALADALSHLLPETLEKVASDSGRNLSTLSQYARAAERWPDYNRVDGVSFSAHRAALSADDPRGLLVELKAKHGSPTVRQVREAMGLEGHPAMEHARKMLKALLVKYSGEADPAHVLSIAKTLEAWANHQQQTSTYVTHPEPEDIDVDTDMLSARGKVDDPRTEPATKPGAWVPPIRTSDVAGL